MKRNKGISLIILVITIIVIIILSGTVILSLSKNNPITSATEATFKTSASEYNSELALYLTTKYSESSTFNPKTLYADKWNGTVGGISGSVKQYITSMTVEDGANYVIYAGKVYYVGIDSNKKDWAKNVGLSEGLVMWLDGDDFKNSPATTTWIDKSGNSNDATVLNFSYTSSSGSDGTGGVAFNGINNYMTISNLYTGNKDWTFLVWVKTSNVGFGPLISNSSGGPIYNALFIENSKVGYWHYNNTWFTKYGISTVTNNTWHLLTWVNHSNKTIDLYVDGVKEAIAVDSTLSINSGPLDIIGKHYDARMFTGIISDIKFYVRSLSDSEVLQNYSLGK
jgi:hypothetical protein